MKDRLPWRKPTGTDAHMRPDGPPSGECIFTIQGVTMQVRNTGNLAATTNRPLFRIVCHTCLKELDEEDRHLAVVCKHTPMATHWCIKHLREVHGVYAGDGI